MTEIDEIDLKILRALVANGRITNNALADEVGLSPSPCWQRVKRLENEGYIKGYSAQLNNEKMGFSQIAFVEVSLSKHDDKTLQKFADEIARIPEVLEVHMVTGGYDFLLKISIKDIKSYERFLSKKLYEFPYIQKSHSIFSLNAIKDTGSISPIVLT